jgi:O-antigen ligase
MEISPRLKPIHVSLFLILALLAVFLPAWNKTQEVEDPKYIIAFLLLPCLLLCGRTGNSMENSGRTMGSRIYWGLFAAFVLYTLCNWHFLSYPYYGTRSLSYLWVCFLSFYLGVTVLSRPGKMTAFCVGCVISGAVSSLYSIGEYLALIPYYNPESWPPRVTGLLAHKNAFSLFVINSSIWTAYFIFSGLHKKWNPLLGTALAIELVALMVSDSRGNILLAGIGFAGVAGPMLLKTGFIKRPGARFACYAFFFLCLLIPIAGWDQYAWERCANFFVNGDAGRSSLYKAEWKLFLAHPLFGCGVGNFVFDNIPFWPEAFRKKTGAFFFAHNAESDFLETLTETGIIGLAFYCFFLFGAVALGFRQLRREWKWETYIVCLLVVVFLCNGIYDAALRRLPLGILVWAFAGYLWKAHFPAARARPTSRPIGIAHLSAFLVHCAIAIFFCRILLGDYYFRQSYVSTRIPDPQSGKMLQKALRVCPFHQEALFEEAFIGIRTGQFDFARRMADLLEKTAPHFMATSFLKGVCAAGQRNWAEALFFANEEIRKNPNYLDAYELKTRALAGLGQCAAMSRLRDSLCIPLRGEKESMCWIDTVASSTIEKMYIEKTGRVRALAGGRHLKEAFLRHLSIRQNKWAKQYAHLHRVSAIRCKAAGESDTITFIGSE